MSKHPVVVDKINDNETHLGLPDTRGTWHQVQIDNEDLVKLHRGIVARVSELQVNRLHAQELNKFKKYVQDTFPYPDEPYDLWIENYRGHKILFADVLSIEHGRAIWRMVAAHGTDLIAFQIKHDEKVLYEGSYVTDEC